MRPNPSAAALATLLLLGTAPLAAQTPQERLWDAAIAGDTAAIRAAAGEGAKLDALDTRRSMNGRLALNWAALNDRVPALRVLLELGAPLEAENLTGFTALHHAAEAGSLDAAKFLLSVGADPKHGNAGGRLPRETAEAQGFSMVVALLAAAERGEVPPRE
jgi:ankyrin repeat protein